MFVYDDYRGGNKKLIGSDEKGENSSEKTWNITGLGNIFKLPGRFQ
ncbi:MAG: hypothetical protein HN561_12910 [Candidatus Scalindua sp.]|nr:hypothetical protein [Candidatus Scalindua sp.]